MKIKLTHEDDVTYIRTYKEFKTKDKGVSRSVTYTDNEKLALNLTRLRAEYLLGILESALEDAYNVDENKRRWRAEIVN